MTVATYHGTTKRIRLIKEGHYAAGERIRLIKEGHYAAGERIRLIKRRSLCSGRTDPFDQKQANENDDAALI